MSYNDKLLGIARRARELAYSPYSRFSVGAAVLTKSGQIFEGANIENSSYGLAICAERVAIFKAISAGEREIEQLAVSCQPNPTNDPRFSMPCGACRQVMSEFADDTLLVIIDGVGELHLKELLPLPFRLSGANKD